MEPKLRKEWPNQLLGRTLLPLRQLARDMALTILRPLRITRFANGVPGVFIVLMTLGLGSGRPVPLSWLPTVILLAVGVVLAVRGYRMGVRYDDTAVTVYGLLRTRVILKASIVEITPFPAVRWRAASGRLRWTPVTAFLESSRGLRFVNAHNQRCVDHLGEWADRGYKRPRHAKH
jgi:hypothetical protein